MRVLFSAHGAYGHLLPVVGLARALDDAGHEVRVAVGDALCPVTRSLGLHAVPAGMSDDTLVAEARRRWPEVAVQPPARWAVRMFTEIAAPAMAPDLEAVIEDWRPALVIHEEGEYAAPVVAAAAGIPCITHGWGSPLRPEASDQRRGATLLDPCPPSLYRALGRDAPGEAIRPTLVTVRDDDVMPEPARPAAYVGFGTVPLYRDRPGLIALAVEALFAAGFATVVVTTPDAALCRTLHGIGGDAVHVREWISLSRVLASSDLVVSHGGAGTALAALAHGLPLLLLPSGSPSQLRMSEACALRGVGRCLTGEDLELADVRDAVEELAAVDSFGVAAREVADEIADMPSPTALVHAATASRVADGRLWDASPRNGRC